MRIRSRVVVALAAVLAIAGVAVGATALEPVTAPGDGSFGFDADARSGATRPGVPTTSPTPASAPPAGAPADPDPGSAPPPPAPVADPAEAEVLAIANGERAANGCGPLAADEGLAAVARAHSADMAARDYFAHENLEGLDPFERATAAGQVARAENIAAGQRDATTVMAAWMTSPGHRANILNCNLTRLGVGVGYGGSYGITWTQLFG